MRVDGHIHIAKGRPDPDGLQSRLAAAGMDGGILLSIPPASFQHLSERVPNQERLSNLKAWTEGHETLFPFFWIDPTEEDAVEQVQKASAAGVRGFKVICNHFYPGDDRALPTYRAVAMMEKPILFHSGILWDGQVSSQYNRPAGFESLLEIEHLRFSLAHISWPWTDELIAVYGKFLSARRLRGDTIAEMFIDTTPGTPPIYRKEALTRIFSVGYDVARNVVFGSDCETGNYDVAWTRQWVDRDTAIFDEIGMDAETVHGVFGENLLRFVGG